MSAGFVRGPSGVPHQPEAERDALVELWTLQQCGCHACNAKLGEESQMMVLCRECGCKRCPKATNHLHACSQSNDSGQFGSSYGDECPDVCCTEYNAFMAARSAEFDAVRAELAAIRRDREQS